MDQRFTNISEEGMSRLAFMNQGSISNRYTNIGISMRNEMRFPQSVSKANIIRSLR